MASVLHDITEDLEGMPRELWADLKKLADDARPAAESALSEARERGTAVGATLVGRLPDRVLERVPDAVSDRLPTPSKGSRGKKLLLIGGLAGAAAALFAWMRRGSAPMQPASGAYPPAPANSNHRGSPSVVRDDPLDLPLEDDMP